ncbi:MAG: hypothetical protein SVU32_02920 [Candidatus Nanohaloarchaea archaeon]|nr:hypothetical protein [Candidatus Nanohaloarchaea archaeon]
MEKKRVKREGREGQPSRLPGMRAGVGSCSSGSRRSSRLLLFESCELVVEVLGAEGLA